MPYYKFSEDDVFYNRLKTHPSCHFFTWKGCTYYNNKYDISGTFNNVVGHISSSYNAVNNRASFYTSSGPSGYINAHELNIDREEYKHNFDIQHVQKRGWTNWIEPYSTASMIFPWITKETNQYGLKSVSYDSHVDDYSKGDIITGSYPLSASVKRIFYENESPKNSINVDLVESGKAHETVEIKDPESPQNSKTITDAPKFEKKYIQALENTIDYYRKWSRHFVYSASVDPVTGDTLAGVDSNNSQWLKSHQTLSIIDVPTIFYGSSIKKGTVHLKYYITGTLVGELKDSRRNGELIQVGPSGSFNSGSVAGVVLYNEGALILTGTWDLTTGLATTFTGPEGTSRGEFGPSLSQDYRYYGSGDKPSWIYFGTGMNDGYPNHWNARRGQYTTDGVNYQNVDAQHFQSSSFEMLLSGTNYIPTITMMAHAQKGYLNWSNNPTYLGYGQVTGSSTGSVFYQEDKDVKIANTISSSFACGSGSFKKQTFISKIGIYDDDKNLIAIAKVATPVRKLETDEYTFKLKLDI